MEVRKRGGTAAHQTPGAAASGCALGWLATCPRAPAAAGLTGADQRITEDVERFSHAISELYSYTFKPLLDVALFTRSLASIMG